MKVGHRLDVDSEEITLTCAPYTDFFGSPWIMKISMSLLQFTNGNKPYLILLLSYVFR